MNREVWKPHPNWNLLWDINFWIDVRNPAIQVKALGAHEVRPASKDEISVLLGYKFEDEEPPADRVAGDTVLYLRPPIPLDPIVCGLC